jgi:hypothetical protein
MSDEESIYRLFQQSHECQNSAVYSVASNGKLTVSKTPRRYGCEGKFGESFGNPGGRFARTLKDSQRTCEQFITQTCVADDRMRYEVKMSQPDVRACSHPDPGKFAVKF